MTQAAAAPALVEHLRLLDVKDACAKDPKPLINEIRFFDPSTEEWVEFRMYPPEGWATPIEHLASGDMEFTREGAQDWFWQSEVITWLHNPEFKKYLIYKARQLGITLLHCAYALWLMLFRPGSACVAYSYTEDEAKKLVEASWLMFLALPDVLTDHVEIITPSRTTVPSEWIKLRHADGRVSSFQALPATKKHGHGTRVTFAIMDEVAYMEYANRIYTSINPAVSRGRAKLSMISTAFGVSNKETGEGNFFHHLYATKKEKGLRYIFLPWNAEPTRDEVWYEKEAMALDTVERNQQYPLNENDGFMLSGQSYFDIESLAWYGNHSSRSLYAGQFVLRGGRTAELMKLRDGIIEVYEEPRAEGEYAIGVDTATGKGYDYTSGDVIDLSSGAIVASLHAKMESPRAAMQLHYLGKWYNKALICVERQGGYGEALILALRDGNKALPVYPKLYRDRSFTKSAQPLSKDYGYPMTEKGRAQVLGELRSWIRQRTFPFLPSGHVDELNSFVYKDTKPSPRAQDGCNDDRVFSLGLAVEMYRQYGTHPEKEIRRKRRKKAAYRPPPTRQPH